jgi:putative ABC transport system substrate-binding protein
MLEYVTQGPKYVISWRGAMRKTLTLLFMLVALGAGATTAETQPVGKIPRIGFLFSGDPSESSARIEAFRQGLRELGHVEGKNIVIEERSSGEKPDSLSNLAAELVGLKVAAIVTMGTSPTQAAKDATGTIPIVMTFVSDPVGFGFVASLARPGGNITGLTNLGPELSGKRLELLKEVLPQTSRVTILLSPGNPLYTFLLKEMQVPAAALGMKLLSLELRGRSPKQVEEAFGTLKNSHPDALMVLPPPSTSLAMKRIVELAVKNRLPTTYHWKEYVEAGGLMYYGPNVPDMYRRAATYVDKILKGTKPADLPVEQPTKFELIINLKAAKQIGLTIPPNVLARADKVIK